MYFSRCYWFHHLWIWSQFVLFETLCMSFFNFQVSNMDLVDRWYHHVVLAFSCIHHAIESYKQFFFMHVLPKPFQPTIQKGLMILIYALNSLLGEVSSLTILFLWCWNVFIKMRSFLVLGMFVALLFTFFLIIVNGVDDVDICFCLHKMKLKIKNKMFLSSSQYGYNKWIMNTWHLMPWNHEHVEDGAWGNPLWMSWSFHTSFCCNGEAHSSLYYIIRSNISISCFFCWCHVIKNVIEVSVNRTALVFISNVNFW